MTATMTRQDRAFLSKNKVIRPTTTARQVPFCLYQKQLDFLRLPTLYRAFVGGRGTGKSLITQYNLLDRAQADCFYYDISPTYSHIKDVAMPEFIKLAGQLGRVVAIRQSDHRGRFQTKDGGFAKITFRSADEPDKVRGANVSGVRLEEASLMSRELFTVVIACLREGGKAGWLTAGFTPKGRAHWTYDVFGSGTHENTSLVKAHSRENPFLAPEFLAAIEAEYGDTELAQQELAGEFVDWKGQLIRGAWIVQCTDSACLWKQNPTVRGPVYLGIDIGRSRDLTVIWTWEKVGETFFAREIDVMANAPYEQQKERIKSKISRHVVKVAIDAGGIGAPLCEDLKRDLGPIVEPYHLASQVQVKVAERFRTGFETGKIRIPDDQTLRDDFQLVSIGDDGLIHTGRKSTLGHADRFWAGALGYDVGYHKRPVSYGVPTAVGRSR